MNNDDKLIEEVVAEVNQATCGSCGERIPFEQDDAKELIKLVRDSDNHIELLKIAYSQLQDSSNAYDSGCNIIRQILDQSPPKQPKE